MNISGGVLKFLALLLAFVLGFLACAGSLFFGGWYIYKNVSYETLQSWGVPLPSTDAVLDTHADVRLTALTLSDLVAELSSLSGYGDRLTMQLLVDRYGVKMSEEMTAMLPEVMMEVSLQTLFSADGISYILDNTTVNYLFNFLPSDILSAPARDALKDKPLSALMGGELSELLADVKLGYFLEVTYEQQADGSYRLVYADPENPTTNELLAPLSVGPLLDAAVSGGDLLKVVKDDIGDCSLKQLAAGASDGDLDPFLKDKTLGDIIVYDAAKGKHVLEAKQLTDDVYLGDVMDYEPVYGDPDDPERITTWLSGGEEVTALEAAMADVTLKEFMSSDFEMSEAVGHLYLGEVMGYVKEVESETYALAAGDEDEVHYVWYEKELDEHGKRVPLKGVNKLVAGILLGDVLRGNESAVTSVFDDMYLGEIMEYDKGEKTVGADGRVTYEWTETLLDGATQTVTGIDRAVANILLGDLLNDEDYELSDAFADLYLGEAIGYEQGKRLAEATEDAPAEYEWLEDDAPVSGIKQKFANYLLGDIIDGTAEISADDMYLYEVMDLHKKEYPAYDEDGVYLTTYTVWYENAACTTPAADVFGALAEMTVAELNSGLPETRIGATIGLFAHEGDWYEAGEVQERIVAGEPEEYVTLTPAKGIMTAFADLSIDDMSNNETVRDAVNDIAMAEALDYTLGENGKYYDADVTNEAAYTYDEATETYYLFGTTDVKEPISGIMAVLAPKAVGDMSTEVDKIYIGEVMGWEPVYDSVDPELRIGWKDADGNTPGGVMFYFADLTVKQMSNEGAVHDVVQRIKLYDALGYTEGDNGKYYDVDVTNTAQYTYDAEAKKYYPIGSTEAVAPVSGIMGVLAPKAVGTLEEDIDDMRLGVVLGWEPTWADENDHTMGVVEWKDADGNPPTGIMTAFADLTVNEMTDEDRVHEVVKTLSLAEAMNYTYDEETDTYYDENGDPITGVLATLADGKIGDMKTEVENTYVGEMMGWVPEWNDPNDHSLRVKEWYIDKDMTQVAKGLAKPFADMTLQEMSDDDLVEQKVESIYVYEVMGYTEGQNGRYYEREYDITNAAKYEYREAENNYYDRTTGDAVPYVTGIMSALAPTQISGLDARVTDLKVKDIFSEADRSHGFLILIDPETYLYGGEGKKGLAETVSDTVATAPIGQLLKRQATDGEGPPYDILPDVIVEGEPVSPQTAELLTLDRATCEILAGLDLSHGKPMGVYYMEDDEGNPIKGPYAYYWQSLTINELLDYIVQSISLTP